MSKAIGVIAEDLSDIDVINAVLEKYSPKNIFYIRRFVGNGCGKLRNKCGTWAQMLVESGCEHVLVFHDLDRNKESTLRKDILNKIPCEKFPRSLIVIPIEEMEAWLLSDEDAIKSVFSLKATPKRYKDCESVKSPKEELERLVWSNGKKRYLNTVHNKRIAEQATLANLRRCPSYRPLDEYLTTKVFAA